MSPPLSTRVQMRQIMPTQRFLPVPVSLTAADGSACQRSGLGSRMAASAGSNVERLVFQAAGTRMCISPVTNAAALSGMKTLPPSFQVQSGQLD